MKFTAAGEGNGELGGKGQEDFKSPVPLEIRWREMFVSMSVVADGADVVGNKAVRGLRHLVIGHDWVVRFAEAFLMNEGEVADVEKSFDLPTCRGVDVHAIEMHLQVIRVVPFGQLREFLGAVVGQTHPHETVTLLCLIHIEMQAGRNGAARMSRDADTAARTVIAQSVVFADDLIALDMTEAEWNAAVVADVACGRDGTVRQPVDHDALIEQARGERFDGHLARVRYRIPERGKGVPVARAKGAVTRQRGNQRRFGGAQVSRRNEGGRGLHA